MGDVLRHQLHNRPCPCTHLHELELTLATALSGTIPTRTFVRHLHSPPDSHQESLSVSLFSRATTRLDRRARNLYSALAPLSISTHSSSRPLLPHSRQPAIASLPTSSSAPSFAARPPPASTAQRRRRDSSPSAVELEGPASKKSKTDASASLAPAHPADAIIASTSASSLDETMVQSTPTAPGGSAHSAHSNGTSHLVLIGHSSTSANGSGGENGSGKDAAQYDGEDGFVPLWEGSNLDRREFVRIAMQAFEEMGYRGTAQALQAESGFSLEPPAVALFRRSVLEGRWADVERYLGELPIEPSADLTPVKFAIRQQKFLEALEARETKTALSVLRNELSPLNHDSNRLHFLSSLVMCMSAEDLRTRAEWDGAAGSSRQQLLVQLQDHISPTVMLPQRRLATLLAQAQAYQQRHHAQPPPSSEPFSLLVDADPNGVAGFPTYTTNVLQEHTDEVWRVQWSHDGEWLATAGKDRTAMIWRVKTGFTLDKVFREHADPVSCLAWSPDDSILLTAAEAVIKMWNTETGSCIATLARHEYAIGALAWLPDGRGFVSGGMDSKLYFWDLAGNVTSHLARCPSRVVDLAISPDGTKLVCVGRADTTEPHLVPSRHASRSATPAIVPSAMAAAGHAPIGARNEKRISVFRLAQGGSAGAGGDSELLYEVVQPQELSSVTISSDSRYAIVSHAPKEIVYVDLEDGTIVRRFEGHDIGKFVIRACFGGASENFILSGSADGKVYVYHRDTGRLLHALAGHERTTVNAVSWNARAPGGGAMWASCSDDRTVRVWGIPPPSAAAYGEGARRGPRLRPLERAMQS